MTRCCIRKAVHHSALLCLHQELRARALCVGTADQLGSARPVPRDRLDYDLLLPALQSEEQWKMGRCLTPPDLSCDGQTALSQAAMEKDRENYPWLDPVGT
jgi:hypothetical protein